jgi:hypothetical protein
MCRENDFLVNHFVKEGFGVVLVNFRSVWTLILPHSVFLGFGLAYRLSRAENKYLFHTEGPQDLCQRLFAERFSPSQSNRIVNRCNKIFFHRDEINANCLIFLGNDFERWDHVVSRKINYWPKVPSLPLNSSVRKEKLLFICSQGAHFKGLDVLRHFGNLGIEVYVVGVSLIDFNSMDFPPNIKNKGWLDFESSIDFLSEVKIAFNYSVSEACPTGLFQMWKSGIQIVLSENSGVKRNSLEGVYVVSSQNELISTVLEILVSNKCWPSLKWKEDLEKVHNHEFIL